MSLHSAYTRALQAVVCHGRAGTAQPRQLQVTPTGWAAGLRRSVLESNDELQLSIRQRRALSGRQHAARQLQCSLSAAMCKWRTTTPLLTVISGASQHDDPLAGARQHQTASKHTAGYSMASCSMSGYQIDTGIRSLGKMRASTNAGRALSSHSAPRAAAYCNDGTRRPCLTMTSSCGGHTAMHG